MIRYPITEIFESVQGEGQWTGTSMAFVRLAGCSVGRRYDDAPSSLPWQVQCTNWDGAGFACDTDFRRKLSLSPQGVMAQSEVGHSEHVCITGGEPLNHRLEELIGALHDAGKKIHIETSGTVAMDPVLRNSNAPDCLWLTVSPKRGYLEDMLQMADEIKVLVDQQTFEHKAFVKAFEPHFPKVWLQPVNGLHTVDMENADLCLILRQRYRLAGVSLQLHKILNVR